MEFLFKLIKKRLWDKINYVSITLQLCTLNEWVCFWGSFSSEAQKALRSHQQFSANLISRSVQGYKIAEVLECLGCPQYTIGPSSDYWTIFQPLRELISWYVYSLSSAHFVYNTHHHKTDINNLKLHEILDVRNLTDAFPNMMPFLILYVLLAMRMK